MMKGVLVTYQSEKGFLSMFGNGIFAKVPQVLGTDVKDLEKVCQSVYDVDSMESIRSIFNVVPVRVEVGEGVSYEPAQLIF